MRSSASSAPTPPIAKPPPPCTPRRILAFVEVFVDAPLDLCKQRDPKGLYARARSGELRDLTGVGSPYERPADPDLVLNSGEESVSAAVDRVMGLLAVRALCPVLNGNGHPAII